MASGFVVYQVAHESEEITRIIGICHSKADAERIVNDANEHEIEKPGDAPDWVTPDIWDQLIDDWEAAHPMRKINHNSSVWGSGRFAFMEVPTYE